MQSGSEVWICGRCRSLNTVGRDRCYKCSTPKAVAATRPEDLSVHAGTHVETPTGTFRSTEVLAVTVGLATIVFIAAGLIARWIIADAIEMTVTSGGDAAFDLLRDRAAILALSPITGIIGLVVYGLWIRRVVLNLPTLGVGYSKVGAGMAFVEPLIPGFNFYSIPARLGEVITKLGGHARAMALLGLALVLAIGPAVVYLIFWRYTRLVWDNPDVVEILSLGLLVVFVCYALALLIGNVVIWQIEGMQRRTLAALKAAPAPAPARRVEPRQL